MRGRQIPAEMKIVFFLDGGLTKSDTWPGGGGRIGSVLMSGKLNGAMKFSDGSQSISTHHLKPAQAKPLYYLAGAESPEGGIECGSICTTIDQWWQCQQRAIGGVRAWG